jgi:hypothetical protein
MPKAIYFPTDWHIFRCRTWLDERNLPWDLIERDRGGFVWINLAFGRLPG